MAKVYIEEVATMGRDLAGYRMTVASEPPVASQTVAIGASSVQSAPFNASTTVVRVHVDAVCSIEIGANPTATASTRRMAASSTEYFGVPADQSFRLAVIQNA